MLKVTYILVSLLFVGVNLLKSGFRDYDLSFVQMMQWTHCIQSPVCVNTSIDVNTFMEEEEFLPFSSPNISSKIPFPDPVPPLMNDGTCCKGCSCDLDHCTLSGTCCPDLLEYLPSLDESASKIKIVCQKASLKKNRSHDLPVGLDVWMFTRCPDDYTDEVTKEKCENPDEFADWDTKIPVVHDRPILHNNYQNIHCALCHNVSRTNLITWEVAVYCSKGELLPSSRETILDEVRLAEYCNIVYKYPLQYDTMDTCEPVISRCNETGEWEEYDAVTEAACHAYIDIYEGKYKNLFCYLCNSWRPYNLPPVCVYFESRPPPPSFSALLKFTASQEETVPNENKENTCLESEIFDKYKVRHVSNFRFIIQN